MQVGRKRQSSPGSTCVLLYLSGDEAYWLHVGDSRLYHFANNELLAQTRDHTVGELIAEAADGGSLDPGSAALLYTCLGGQNALQPEHGASILGERDWFLLCSDGFWHQVDAAEAAGLRQATRSADGGAARMVELAVQRGGARGDNVSLVLATRSETRLGRLWRRVRGG